MILCPTVQPLWFASPLAVRVASFSSLHEMVVAFLSATEDELVSFFQTWLYTLWDARNAIIFHDKPVTIESLLQRASALLEVPQPGPEAVQRARRNLPSS